MWQSVIVNFSLLFPHLAPGGGTRETDERWDCYFSFVMRSLGRTVTLGLVTIIFIIHIYVVPVQTRRIFIATNLVLRKVQNQRQNSVAYLQPMRQTRSNHKKQEVEVKEIPVKRKRGPSCLFRCLRFGKLHPAQCHMMCW